MKELHAFDLDDTLVETHSQVRVTKADGSKLVLTPAQYASYMAQEGDSFDFKDFDDLEKPRRTKLMKVFRNKVIEANGKGCIILTARATKSRAHIRKYLDKFIPADCMKNVRIITLGSSSSFDKAIYLRDKVLKDSYESVEFVDDSWNNCRTVGDILNEMPEVKRFRIVKV